MSEAPYTNPSGFSAPPVALPPEPNKFFFGRFGLRAGYGIAIFVSIAYIVVSFASMVALGVSGQMNQAMLFYEKYHSSAAIAQHIQFKASFVIANDGIGFFVILAYCWLVSKAEQRPLHYYGIGKSRIRDFIPGAFWGLLSMSVLVLFLRLQHLLIFDGRADRGASIFYYGFVWLLAFVLVGFAEEYQIRGYLQYTLTRGFWGIAERVSPKNPQPVAFWIAASLMSLVFGALHLLNGGENSLGILQVVLVGLVFSYALYRTGSLWWGIGYHALWDWSQSFLFGVPDSGNISVGGLFITHPAGKKLLSGGTDGPEGSIFSTIVLVLTIFIIYFTTKRGINPPPDQLPLYEESLPPESNGVIA